MTAASLLFKTREKVSYDKHRVIELFFRDWVDRICEQQVRYKIERDIDKDWIPGMVHYRETFRVDFDYQEDAVALRLRGLPNEFRDYLEIVI